MKTKCKKNEYTGKHRLVCCRSFTKYKCINCGRYFTDEDAGSFEYEEEQK